jgi:hypothetical protein
MDLAGSDPIVIMSIGDSRTAASLQLTCDNDSEWKFYSGIHEFIDMVT